MSETQPHPTPFEPKPSASEAPASEVRHMAPSSAPAASAHVEPHRLLAACSYLGVLFIIPLLVEKDDEFVKFHLRQGIALFVLGVVASFGFHYRRGGSALMFVIFIISLFAAFRAWRGRRWTLPVIGRYAAKIAL